MNYWGEAPLVRSAFVCTVRLSVYVGLTIFKVNKLLTLIAGFAPSMFYILLVYCFSIFPARARSARAGPKIVLVPPLSIFIGAKPP